MRSAGVALAMTLLTFAACKHTGEANGEGSRDWAPPQQGGYFGGAAGRGRAGVQQRPDAQPAPAGGRRGMEERVDSALALTLREDDFAAGLVRMRPQNPGYEALRTQLGQFRELVAHGSWPTVPAGRALKRGDSDSPARLDALRARLRAEGF